MRGQIQGFEADYVNIYTFIYMEREREVEVRVLEGGVRTEEREPTVSLSLSLVLRSSNQQNLESERGCTVCTGEVRLAINRREIWEIIWSALLGLLPWVFGHVEGDEWLPFSTSPYPLIFV